MSMYITIQLKPEAAPQVYTQSLSEAGLKGRFFETSVIGRGVIELTDTDNAGNYKKDAQRLCQWILQHVGSIAFVSPADHLIKEASLTGTKAEQILTLDLLPSSKRVIPALQRGVFLARTENLGPIWICYSGFEQPILLRRKEHRNPRYDVLYRDNNGHCYLLMPVYNNSSPDFLETVYEGAYRHGIQEEFTFFMGMLYPLPSKQIGIEMESILAKKFSVMYTREEEIKYRLGLVMSEIRTRLGFNKQLEGAPKSRRLHVPKVNDDPELAKFVTLANAFIKATNDPDIFYGVALKMLA